MIKHLPVSQTVWELPEQSYSHETVSDVLLLLTVVIKHLCPLLFLLISFLFPLISFLFCQ